MSALASSSGGKALRAQALLDPASGALIWMIAATLFVLFSIFADGFLTTFNMTSIMSEAVLVGFLAVGLTPVIISRNIDLSVGSVVGLSACLAVGLQPYGLWVSVPVALGAGLAVGFVNGLLTEKAGINSFIVTLATMIGVRGLTFFYAGDRSLAAMDPNFLAIGTYAVGPVPARAILLVLIAMALAWMLRSTSHGRATFAIGGNRTAAVDAGIRVSRHVIANMAICGLAAGLCGVAMASELGAATPSYGRDYELWAITAVVLGGTRLRGGAGSILGSVGAVLALTILRNGMNLVQVPPFYIPIVMGLALIVALVADRKPGAIVGGGGE